MTRACGSSPRVRGTASAPGSSSILLRFIPACAGNSAHKYAGSPRSSVHPRVCGEQQLWPREIVQWVGSSPRVRGTVFGVAPTRREHDGSSPRVRGTDGLTFSKLFNIRFIPACAGNRIYCYRRSRGIPVHPRVCGEQDQVSLGVVPCCGSSPRVRGTEGILSNSPSY